MSTPLGTLRRVLPLSSPRQLALFLLYTLVPLIGSFLGWALNLVGSDSNVYWLAGKSNFVNRMFVKWGWAWTSLPLYILISARLLSSSASPAPPASTSTLLLRLTPPTLRYIVATAYWFSLTQWFLGHGLFDRVLHLPGSQCSQDAHLHTTARSCKRNGHEWLGFDISGHCFLLVWASLVLWEEGSGWEMWRAWERQVGEAVKDLLGFANAAQSGKTATKRKVSGGTSSAQSDPPISSSTFYTSPHPIPTPSTPPASYLSTLGLILSLFLIVLWLAMLISTALFFHTLAEKVWGTLFGVTGWAVTYAEWNTGVGPWGVYKALGVAPGEGARGEGETGGEGGVDRSVDASNNTAQTAGSGSATGGKARTGSETISEGLRRSSRGKPTVAS